MPIPPKEELEKNILYRLIKVLYILFILYLIGLSIAGVYLIYDDLQPSYNFYLKTTSGSWGGAIAGGFFSSVGFTIGIIILHKVIKTTFFYILYGKKDKQEKLG